jgi:hypothetical protein
VWPGFDASLAASYRQALVGAGGPSVSDDDWESLLADAVVYSVVVQIGTLVELVARTQVRGGLLTNLAWLIERLDATVGVADATRADLRGLLTELGVRASFGSRLSERPGVLEHQRGADGS